MNAMPCPSACPPSALPADTPGAADERERELFAGLRRGGPDADRCRDELFARYAPLAVALSRRYRFRGESEDVLRQIAYVGLLEALRRFEPERGVEFPGFAQPTVLGLLRRHFRDHRRCVRVPRRLQQLGQDIREAQETLAARDHRHPTVRDLAAHLAVSERDIGEAMLGDQFFALASLDAPSSGSEDRPAPQDRLGADDPRLDTVIGCTTILPLVNQLPDRERDIVISTFWYEEPQSSIGRRWGVTQMQISRLLTRTLHNLRQAAA